MPPIERHRGVGRENRGHGPLLPESATEPLAMEVRAYNSGVQLRAQVLKHPFSALCALVQPCDPGTDCILPAPPWRSPTSTSPPPPFRPIESRAAARPYHRSAATPGYLHALAPIRGEQPGRQKEGTSNGWEPHRTVWNWEGLTKTCQHCTAPLPPAEVRPPVPQRTTTYWFIRQHLTSIPPRNPPTPPFSRLPRLPWPLSVKTHAVPLPPYLNLSPEQFAVHCVFAPLREPNAFKATAMPRPHRLRHASPQTISPFPPFASSR